MYHMTKHNLSAWVESLKLAHRSVRRCYQKVFVRRPAQQPGIRTCATAPIRILHNDLRRLVFLMAHGYVVITEHACGR